MTERIRQAVEQSIEIIRRRIDETGTKEPTIQRQGTTASWCSSGRRTIRSTSRLFGRPPS